MEFPRVKITLPDALYLLAMMWFIQILQLIMPSLFIGLGIYPRTISGLWQIPLAPWLHHGFFHLIANSLPFLILGSLIQFKSRQDFWFAVVVITLIAGLGIWIFGGSAYHAGASSLVFGFWTYLLANAWYCRSVKSLLLAMVAMVIYGGMIFALADVRPHISWSGHAFGALGGVVAAMLKTKLTPRP